MKVLKWFFGISALYGLVKVVRAYRAEADKIKEGIEKEEVSKPMLVVGAIGAVFSIGMTWPMALFDKLVAVPVAVLFALIERIKQRGENAYENN